MSTVTVAIPVRNGGALLEGVLRALAAQTVAHELLVCDSGSSDGSQELARRSGARVLEIGRAEFSHGATRNLLVQEASGSHVAFLTQDAEPADPRWLERLLTGFELAPDVGLVYGPYIPRPDASLGTRLELERWFASLAPDRQPTLERLTEPERMRVPSAALVGRRGFFTDANACVSRVAWRRVPFRPVGYAEDRMLAIDMMRAGFAKAFLPEAAVVHSHDYSLIDEFRRGFDEWRALREVYGWREPARPAERISSLRGELGYARRELAREDMPAARRCGALGATALRHAARHAGAILGSRADRLPGRLREHLSLERRAEFEPLGLDRAERRIGTR